MQSLYVRLTEIAIINLAPSYFFFVSYNFCYITQLEQSSSVKRELLKSGLMLLSCQIA